MRNLHNFIDDTGQKISGWMKIQNGNKTALLQPLGANLTMILGDWGWLKSEGKK